MSRNIKTPPNVVLLNSKFYIMKNVLKSLIVIMLPFLMASCGGDKAGKLVGEWKVDVSSFDLVLGDGVPDPIKGMVEGQKAQMLSEAEKEAGSMSIEFKEDGKMVLTADGESEEMDYSVSGKKLNLKGEIEGEKVDVYLTLADVSADKFTVALTGEDILSQMKEKYPEEFEQAKGMAAQMGDIEAMMKGSKVAISFKK